MLKIIFLPHICQKRSGVFIVSLELISHLFLVFLLLTLSMYLFARCFVHDFCALDKSIDVAAHWKLQFRLFHFIRIVDSIKIKFGQLLEQLLANFSNSLYLFYENKKLVPGFLMILIKWPYNRP